MGVSFLLVVSLLIGVSTTKASSILENPEYLFDEAGPDYQIINLPPIMKRSAQKYMMDGGGFSDETPIGYEFNAFGRKIDLQLKPNKGLIAPNFKTFIRISEDQEPDILDLDQDYDCHFIYNDDNTIAALSTCQDDNIHGLVVIDNTTFEIKPVTSNLKSFLKIQNDEDSYPHIIRKAAIDIPDFATDFQVLPIENSHKKYSGTKKTGKYTLEVALFFDEAGYRIFSPHLNNNDKEIRDMLLAYMNGVQALYHHPSLGTSLEITLVRLDILKKQPSDLPHYDGERSQLLDSFCNYQMEINPPKDSDPGHWDMALYVSGLDFFAIENGKRSDVTMGLATVGGVCLEQYACVIAELGTTNVFGKPYPSAGFTSVYILAHEIGHNLGMHHDSSGNSCSKDGYIMSPSRGTLGETIWSSCSAEVMRKISDYKCLMDKPGEMPEERNHNKYQDTPGQTWGAKKQCEILLRDKDARVSPGDEDICQRLKCRTPHRSGYYMAGPALEGTDCGEGKWCQGGSCVKMQKKKPDTVQGGWSNWKIGECKSGCLVKGKGYLTKTRNCDNPAPVNSDGCEGNSYEVVLCKDKKICGKTKRQPVGNYATTKCKEFSTHLSDLDPTGPGLQAPHEDIRPWMACSIFCKKKDLAMYYTPRMDLNDLGVDPYFPDGSWCHNDEKEDYYCVQHHCLPESFKSSKVWDTSGEDVPLSGNARLEPLPLDIQKYLSLGPDGRPLMTSLHPGKTFDQPVPDDDQWENDHDYIEIANKG